MTGPGSRLSAGLGVVVMVLSIVIPASLLPSEAQAADWPQWRGPARNGKSPDTGLLGQWPEGGPPLEWRVSGLGGGFSSVAVAG